MAEFARPRVVGFNHVALEVGEVSRMDEVLARAMTRKLEPIAWDETTTTATAVPEEAPVEEEASTLTAH